MIIIKNLQCECTIKHCCVTDSEARGSRQDIQPGVSQTHKASPVGEVFRNNDQGSHADVASTITTRN